MTRNPLRLKLHPLETLSSYVSRFALMYCAPDAETFVGWFGAGFSDVCRGSKADLEKIAEIVDCAPAEMIRRVIVGKRLSRSVFDMEVPRSYLRQFEMRVCPGCVLDDELHGYGQIELRPFERITWSFAHHSVCPRHRMSLVALPYAANFRDDFCVRLRMARENSQDFLNTGGDEEPSPIDKYIFSRIEGDGHSLSWLDDFPLPVAMRLCEAFGRDDFHSYRNRPPKWTRTNYQMNDGFTRIAASIEHFRNEVRDMIIRNYPRRTFSAYSIFAELAIEFIDDLQRPEFARVAEIMRELASEMLPLGPGDDVFGIIEKRRFHTVNTAAREFEIPASVLRKVFGEDPIEQATQRIPTLYDTSMIEEIVRGMHYDGPEFDAGTIRFKKMLERERICWEEHSTADEVSFPSRVAARKLSVKLDVFWSLVHDGHLAIFPGRGLKSQWRIAKMELAEFQRRYISGNELRQLLGWKKSIAELALHHKFAPLICKVDVGEDFFSRSGITSRP